LMRTERSASRSWPRQARLLAAVRMALEHQSGCVKLAAWQASRSKTSRRSFTPP
jgi:hypothetical protein